MTEKGNLWEKTKLISAEAFFSNWKRSCHFQRGHSAQCLFVEYVFLYYLTIL